MNESTAEKLGPKSFPTASTRVHPRVSAVINTYNHKKYIGKAIQSILDQTLRPFEIIVVDDGSTDGTEEFVRTQFGDLVRYHYQAERGIGASRNAGMRLASGDWIAFLDSDDYWAPEKLELQMAVTEANPKVAMVACIGVECTPEGVIFGEVGLPRPFTMKTIRRQLRRRCIFCCSGLLIRRDVLQIVGGFPEDLMFGEDLVTFARIAAEHNIEAVQRALFYKMQLPGGLSSRPHAVLRDGLISFQRCKEALARRTWPGNWIDTVAFRQSEAQLFFHAAWVHIGMRDKRKAAMAVIRGITHCPVLTIWQYRSVYWLCGRLLQRSDSH